MTYLALFLAAAAVLAAVPTARGETSPAPARDYYELRIYHFDSAAQQARYDRFLQDALVPALNRAGVAPVGVFTVENQPEDHRLYVFLPFPSLQAFGSLNESLAGDSQLHTAGAAIWNLPSSDPPYARIESSLLLAFTGMPGVHIPAETALKKGRVFELRTYSSHSERAGLKKIEMFNEGEIGVFQRAGFQPVFYGQSLIGGNQPSLTYMVTYPDGVERGSLWAKFGADPECKKLFAIPGYQDKEIVSKIDHVFLRPTVYSQL